MGSKRPELPPPLTNLRHAGPPPPLENETSKEYFHRTGTVPVGGKEEKQLADCQEALKEALKLFQLGHDYALAVTDLQDRIAIGLSEQRAKIHQKIQTALGNVI